MAKKKKAKGKNWNKMTTRWISQNQTALAFIGGVAGGAALTAAIISKQGQQLFMGVSDTVKDWMPIKTEMENEKREKKNIPAAAAS
jgi:hypothetical protein